MVRSSGAFLPPSPPLSLIAGLACVCCAARHLTLPESHFTRVFEKEIQHFIFNQIPEVISFALFWGWVGMEGEEKKKENLVKPLYNVEQLLSGPWSHFVIKCGENF